MAKPAEQMNTKYSEGKPEKEALQRAEAELRALFDNLPEGIAVTDLNGIITDVNPTVVRVHGFSSKDELIGKSAFDLIAPDECEEAKRNLQVCLEKGSNCAFEYTFLRANGSTFPAELSASVLKDSKGNPVGFVAVTRDVTERKKDQESLAKAKTELEMRVTERTAELLEANASLRIELNIRREIEKELRKSERFNTNLLENAPNPISVSNADRTMAYVNKAMKNLTGFTDKELLGAKRPYPWWPPEKYDEYEGDFRRDAGKKSTHLERLFRKKNGEYFWVDMTSTSLVDDNGDFISRITIWQDITERKITEAQLLAYQNELRSLSSQLTLAEQTERRKIAILIHDGVTQLLALSGMKMEVLMESVSGSQTEKSLNEIYKIIQQAIEDTRTLTFELCPPSLYDLGLEAALEELVEQYGKDQCINPTYVDDGRPKSMDESTCVLLFQATRELLHNVEQHARAHTVKVSTEKVGDNIHVIVEDDGIGFDIKPVREIPKKSTQFGLFGIQERFRYIGGRLRLSPQRAKAPELLLSLR